jgi:hypothetical protein
VSALGVLLLIIPLYKVSWVLFAIQCLITIKLLLISARLFSTWDMKKREIILLRNRNSTNFRPETFKIYMQAPCSRLVVRVVLNELNLRIKYKELLIYKKPFLVMIRDNLKPVEQSIYINDDYL